MGVYAVILDIVSISSNAVLKAGMGLFDIARTGMR